MCILVAHRTTLPTDAHLGSHRSSVVAKRNLDSESTQLKRFIADGCPLMGIVKDGEFPKMHEYFEKYMTAIEESNRSTKSLEFLETLRDLKQEEIKALMDSMDAEVGPHG